MFQESFKEELSMFGGISKKTIWSILHLECHQRVSKRFSGLFQRCFKGVSRKSQGCFLDVSRVFQKILNGVSSKIEGCFKEGLQIFKRSSKRDSKMF